MKQIPYIMFVIAFIAIVAIGLLTQRPAMPPSFERFTNGEPSGAPPSFSTPSTSSTSSTTSTSSPPSTPVCGEFEMTCKRLFNFLFNGNVGRFRSLSNTDQRAIVAEMTVSYDDLRENDALFQGKTADEQNTQIYNQLLNNPSSTFNTLMFPSTSGAAGGPGVAGGPGSANSGPGSANSGSSGGGRSCPSSAYRDSSGRIHVVPGGETYENIIYFRYAMNRAGCPMPKIEIYNGPIAGLFGGQGTGTASASQVSKQAADRSAIATALSSGGERSVTMEETPGEQTSTTTPINRLDDYEYSRVYELENAPRNSKLSKQQKNALTNQYVLDWSALPFNSEARAAAEDEFVAARLEDGFREPKTGVFFKTVEGFEVSPPDHAAVEEREQKVMTGYKPTTLTKHVVDDEMERVAKVVAQTYSTDPDWEPIVEKTGEHQYSVTELRPKPKKERWQGEGAPTVEEAKEGGLVSGESLNPNVSIQDSSASGDPFFDKNGVVDYTNNRFWRYQDFNKWTPGLERMFAPTNETKAWF